MSKGSREEASEGPTVPDQQFQEETRVTSPDVTTVFHTWVYGRFIEIQSNLRGKETSQNKLKLQFSWRQF